MSPSCVNALLSRLCVVLCCACAVCVTPSSGKHRFVEKKFRLYEGDLGLGEAIIFKKKIKKENFLGAAAGRRRSVRGEL